MAASYLIELTGSNGTTYGFDTGEGFSPTDPPAALWRSHYHSKVAEGGAPVITREPSGAGTVGPAITGTTFSTIRLLNSDRALDVMKDIGFDGRALTILYKPDGAKTRASCTTVYAGTVTQVIVGRHEVTVDARDRWEELNVPLADFISASDWPDAEGVRKPVVAGKALECPIIWVDRVKYIGIIHDGVADVDSSGSPEEGGVYDLGVSLEREADYASLSALQSTAPTAGKYKLYPSSDGTYIRLGSRPSDFSKIAADVLVTDYDGPAQIQALAERAGTISTGSPSDIDAASFTALSRAWDVGGYWPGEATVADAIADVARSIGASVFFSRTGILKAALLIPAAGSAVASFYGPQSVTQGGGASQLYSIERTKLSEPMAELSVGYDRVYAKKDDLSALWATDATRAKLISEEYRYAVADDAATASKHLLARKDNIQTVLRGSTNAGTVGEELRAAQGAFHYPLAVQASPAILAALEIGARIDVYDQQIITTEASLIVRSIAHDIGAGTITIGARE